MLKEKGIKDRYRVSKIIEKIEDETIKDYLNHYIDIDRGALRPVYDNELVGFLIEYLRKNGKISEILFFNEEYYPKSSYNISIRYLNSGNYTHSDKDILDALLIFLEENNI